MARGHKVLTAEQKAKLQFAAEADDAWRKAKKYAVEEALKKAAEQIAHFALARDLAIDEAFQAGVPKSTIGRDALGSKNPYIVTEAVERVGESMQAAHVALPTAPKDRFMWGVILGANSNAVYGWVLDWDHPATWASSATGTGGKSDGFWVTVDRRNHTTLVKVEDTVYTQADGGYAELREWAIEHAGEATHE